MPRSYSFDHYLVPKTGQPKPPRGVRGKGGKKKPTGTAELHYGKQHAETEELYQAHQMEQELEELAGIAGKTAEGHKRMSKPRGESRPQAMKGDPMDRIRKEVPIGAIPVREEPLENSRFRDVWDDGVRQFHLLREGVKDIYSAGMKLVQLPRELFTVMFRRPRHA